MESPAVISGDRANSREEQANYFYVVWPEETVTTLSAAAGAGRFDPTLCSSAVHKSAAGLHRHSHTLQNHKHREHQLLRHGPGMEHPSVAPLSPPGKHLPEIEVGTFASPLTSPILSIADASPLVTQSSANSVHSPREYSEKTSGPGNVADKRDGESRRSNLPCEPSSSHPSSANLSSFSHNGLPSSSTMLQNSAEGDRVGRLLSKTSGQGNGRFASETVTTQYMDHDSAAASRRKRSRTQYYNLNGCLECEVKDAEIKTLRRRIQVMEEVVALLNQKLSAVQQSSNGVLFSPLVMPPVVSQVVIPSTYTTPPTTSVKVHTPGVSVDSNHCITATSPHVSSDTEDASSDSASIAYAQAELCPSAEQRVELIPGTGVYVTLPQLEEARREAKNGTQLARKLMDAFWDRETLARSSLSSKSKYQYQQLDPNVISAIGSILPEFRQQHSLKGLACLHDRQVLSGPQSTRDSVQGRCSSPEWIATQRSGS